MTDTIILLDGENACAKFYSDLSLVMDHSYDVDELFTFYEDWCRLGELFIDQYVRRIYPVFDGSMPEEREEAEDNQIALRNAMINLYCALDRLTPGLDRRRVVHAAHCPDEQLITISVR